MVNAKDLQDLASQAYDSFKHNAQNVSQVNAALQQVLAAAKLKAQHGEYSCTLPLGNLDVSSSNSVLFQRLLGDKLEALDFVVTFEVTVKENWVTVEWFDDSID